MSEEVLKHSVAACEPIRLDSYLAQNKLTTSRAEAARWIADSRVRINGQIGKPSTVVKEGDQLLVSRPSLKISDLTPVKMALKVLFEDKDLLVIDKPAGLVVHPGAGHYDVSLVHGLLAHCDDLSGIGGVERPGIVHRLDKGTSGVMVIAKNDKSHHALTEQFKNRIVKKQYLAIVLGRCTQEKFSQHNLIKRAELNRKKFVVNAKKGKEAITDFICLKFSKRASLVQAFPHTGRTHQIRVHLAHAGFPIMGDELYGGLKRLDAFSSEEKDFIKEQDRPFLHAEKLAFHHPRLGKKMEFFAKIPQDMQHAIRRFVEDKND